MNKVDCDCEMHDVELGIVELPTTTASPAAIGGVGGQHQPARPSRTPSSLAGGSVARRTMDLKLKLSMVVFCVQVAMLVSLITTSIVNISLGREPKELWVALLSTCLGILLPSPNIKGRQLGTSGSTTNGL